MADTDLRQAARDFQSEPSDISAARLLVQQSRSGLTSTKVFAVVKHTFQYNDENYSSGGYTQNEAYSLQKVYVNREAAQKQCDDQNVKELSRSA